MESGKKGKNQPYYSEVRKCDSGHPMELLYEVPYEDYEFDQIFECDKCE